MTQQTSVANKVLTGLAEMEDGGASGAVAPHFAPDTSLDGEACLDLNFSMSEPIETPGIEDDHRPRLVEQAPGRGPAPHSLLQEDHLPFLNFEKDRDQSAQEGHIEGVNIKGETTDEAIADITELAREAYQSRSNNLSFQDLAEPNPGLESVLAPVKDNNDFACGRKVICVREADGKSFSVHSLDDACTSASVTNYLAERDARASICSLYFIQSQASAAGVLLCLVKAERVTIVPYLVSSNLGVHLTGDEFGLQVAPKRVAINKTWCCLNDDSECQRMRILCIKENSDATGPFESSETESKKVKIISQIVELESSSKLYEVDISCEDGLLLATYQNGLYVNTSSGHQKKLSLDPQQQGDVLCARFMRRVDSCLFEHFVAVGNSQGYVYSIEDRNIGQFKICPLQTFLIGAGLDGPKFDSLSSDDIFMSADHLIILFRAGFYFVAFKIDQSRGSIQLSSKFNHKLDEANHVLRFIGGGIEGEPQIPLCVSRDFSGKRRAYLIKGLTAMPHNGLHQDPAVEFERGMREPQAALVEEDASKHVQEHDQKAERLGEGLQGLDQLGEERGEEKISDEKIENDELDERDSEAGEDVSESDDEGEEENLVAEKKQRLSTFDEGVNIATLPERQELSDSQHHIENHELENASKEEQYSLENQANEVHNQGKDLESTDLLESEPQEKLMAFDLFVKTQQICPQDGIEEKGGDSVYSEVAIICRDVPKIGHRTESNHKTHSATPDNHNGLKKSDTYKSIKDKKSEKIEYKKKPTKGKKEKDHESNPSIKRHDKNRSEKYEDYVPKDLLYKEKDPRDKEKPKDVTSNHNAPIPPESFYYKTDYVPKVRHPPETVNSTAPSPKVIVKDVEHSKADPIYVPKSDSSNTRPVEDSKWKTDLEAVLREATESMATKLRHAENSIRVDEGAVSRIITSTIDKYVDEKLTQHLKDNFNCLMSNNFHEAFEDLVVPCFEKYLTKVFDKTNSTFERGLRYFTDKLLIEEKKVNQLKEQMGIMTTQFSSQMKVMTKLSQELGQLNKEIVTNNHKELSKRVATLEEQAEKMAEKQDRMMDMMQRVLSKLEESPEDKKVDVPPAHSTSSSVDQIAELLKSAPQLHPVHGQGVYGAFINQNLQPHHFVPQEHYPYRQTHHPTHVFGHHTPPLHYSLGPSHGQPMVMTPPSTSSYQLPHGQNMHHTGGSTTPHHHASPSPSPARNPPSDQISFAKIDELQTILDKLKGAKHDS